MIFKHNIARLAGLLSIVLLISSCSDEIEIPAPENESPASEGVFDGYSISFALSLDPLGGRAIKDTPEELAHWENYIDPTKVRILFFTNGDKFLFESKSRWVKQLEDNLWQISVPLFTYGNDYYDGPNGEILEYNWEEIRRIITTEQFKIAALVNRPEMDYFDAYNVDGKTISALEPGWFYNVGPQWGPSNSIATTGVTSADAADVFDLHHCQYDPIYVNKSTSTGYYDFIMDWDDSNGKTWGGQYSADENTFYTSMGATSCWVSGNKKYIQNENDTTGFRFIVLPSAENPIPMYGIQRYEPIPPDKWIKGTTFNVSDGLKDTHYSDIGYEKKAISLLRSVVRLDLKIPKKVNNIEIEPEFVALVYLNINARCEPMNVWDPTDVVWDKNHNHSSSGKCKDQELIEEYGSPVTINLTTGNFKSTYSWFYGAWAWHGKWNFHNIGNILTDLKKKSEDSYPQIFNSIVQRNSTSIVHSKKTVESQKSLDQGNVTEYYGDNCYHYVAYVGERNITDPSSISTPGSTNINSATMIYWMFEYNGKVYSAPLTDYSTNPGVAYLLTQDYDGTIKATGGNKNFPEATYQNYITGAGGTAVTPAYNNWPLIRNHIYKITVGTKAGGDKTTTYSRSAGDVGLTFKSEDLHSHSISR
ncbi:MAG: hypothetical protein J1E99_07485 [Muribaculaceae bacterium]|nr:hypothetical protein [Muribaculaceae bacterium]